MFTPIAESLIIRPASEQGIYLWTMDKEQDRQ